LDREGVMVLGTGFVLDGSDLLSLDYYPVATPNYAVSL